MKTARLLLLIVCSSLLAAACWADGADPKVGVIPGGGSIPLTPGNPNASFTGTAGTSGCTSGTACLIVDFQNDLGHTLNTLSVLINPISGLSFTCADSAGPFFASCASTVLSSGVTDLVFSGGPGISSACMNSSGGPPSALDDYLWSLPAIPLLHIAASCKGWDPDDYVGGGEFAIDIEAVNGDLKAGTTISGTVVTPEPGSGLLVLFGMLVFGLVSVIRRNNAIIQIS